MIKNTLFFFTLFLLGPGGYSAGKQAEKFAFIQKVDSDDSIVFLSYNKNFKLYSRPRLLSKGKLKKIDQFDEANYTNVKVAVSADKKFLVIDNIIKGYVETEKGSVLHENYGCVILDVKKAKVLMGLNSDCGGAWNKKNEWESAGKIIFKDGDIK